MLDDVLVLDEVGLRARLSMTAAIDTLEKGFTDDAITAPGRMHLSAPNGDLLVMPATGPAGAGVKLVTVTPANADRHLPLIHGLYLLFDPTTGAPRALVDGAALTGLRTAAVSGLATRHLARADATRLVVFGAGTQARTHVKAMRAVRPVDHVTVVSRSPGPAAALVDEIRSTGLDAVVGTPDVVTEADLVCTCTTSDDPVVAGDDLPAGVHVNAVGAHRPTSRELDTEAVVGSRVVVEERAAALAEGGDLAIPVAEGAFDAEDIVADLAEIVAGAIVRRHDDDRTLFKSVGLSREDLIVVTAALAAG